ncbi:NarK family nitrate/nitrite MFS transporter [Argonema galeatum]|uniref:NarK family nitrate/nitrite MFS transporter n=1 Tax=Argonema galeatum TaxID=2942762 RepID=UPI0020124A8E|nr:NarK family nitrate/nitrite MFS transporter [Argonema galeatum]MCL1467048.1 NarK family nitrate/nitrite MFS transporter [Argonema galeatum A003/A1]
MLLEMWSLKGRFKILHLTWFAFFLTFVCWFNFAPFATTIGKELNLEDAQIKTLLICNLALTIPARIIIGMLLDKFGPRITYSILLMFAVVPCLATAMSQNFSQLVISRLLMGIVGAGFVVGIRMVSEWFPPKDIGIAEGVYGGWGNFGAFGAEFALPTIALSASFLAGGSTNWRLTIALTGIVAAIYGWIYYNNVEDTPPGVAYRKPKRSGAIEVTSARSYYAMLVSNFGLIFALCLLAWRLAQPKIHFLNNEGLLIAWFLLGWLFVYQTIKAWHVNKEVVEGKKTYSPSERYEFRQVAILEMCYIVTFGSELAAVSMLPGFFEKTFSLEHVVAGMIAACYPFLNLVSRPSGGLISDKLGSRKWTMTILAGCVGVGYLMAHFINASWSIPMAMAITMFCAYFAQAGCGSTYAIVPLIKKEITGQVSGNVGAYGNFGGVVFLTIFSLTDAPTLFTTMGVSALVCAFLCAFFLKEPKGSFAAHYQGEAEEVQLEKEIPTLPKSRLAYEQEKE